MTDYTLRILKYPEGATREILEAPGRSLELAQDLNSHAREFGGRYHLQSWAEANGAPLYFIDNCSVRAVASGALVRAFAMEALKDATIDSSIEDDSTYLIAASEF